MDKGVTMGLDTTHDCWHGSYSSFGEFRRELARVGLGIKLNEMQGFAGEVTSDGRSMTEKGKPWYPHSEDPLVILLNHSDCDGEIKWEYCRMLAHRLLELAPKMGDWRSATVQFANGLLEAFDLEEDVEFH
jgi:hypothetical protein